MKIDDSICCLACGSKNFGYVLKGSPYSLLKCEECGLVATHPMPTDLELSQFYQGFSFQLEETKRMRSYLPAIRKSLLYFIGRGPGRFLDYGGATGIYALAASQLGWESSLFDYDEQMVEFGHLELNIKNAYSDWELIDGDFDVLFAFHVVEHWNDWDRHFEQLLAKLATGGRILIATPNAFSNEKSVRIIHRRRYVDRLVAAGEERAIAERVLQLDDSITCWDPPRHLFAFTPDSFREIGKRFNLKTRIWTGYNSSPIFEPRGYVAPSLFRLLLRERNWTRRLKGRIKHLATSYMERQKLITLSRTTPSLGEQLYVEYTKD